MPAKTNEIFLLVVQLFESFFPLVFFKSGSSHSAPLLFLIFSLMIRTFSYVMHWVCLSTFIQLANGMKSKLIESTGRT